MPSKNIDIKTSSIPNVSVKNIIDTLTEMYSVTINNNCPLKSLPSVMLWGAPGVGKSQAIRELADRIAKETSKSVNVIDVRLLLFSPIDLRGIPTANNEKTLSVWLKPKIFDMDESDNVVNILFLDEISAAAPSVQAAAYQITLDRIIGEHKLPDNCIIIASGNRVTDRSVAFKMPKALANRLLHLEVEIDVKSWLDWAKEKSIHPFVINFIKSKSEYLMQFNSSDDDVAFPTPRTWELVSNILNNVSQDINKVKGLIAGLIGTGASYEFCNYVRTFGEIPNIEDIFNGTATKIPKQVDCIYSIISSMVKYAKNHMYDEKLIENSLNYAMNLPSDYVVILVKEYLCLDDNYREFLMSIPTFRKWITQKGSILNGII